MPHRIALIADPHYHEIFPGYGFAGVEHRGRTGAALRTFADTLASTRIYNESDLAFRAALDAAAAEGVRLVVIAGDLTDDGQSPSLAGALALLAEYEQRHGMRFFLTPGNHDVYGMSGRHHSKRFLTADGVQRITSDPAADGLPEPGMRCLGCGDLLPLWARHGMMRRPEDLHWESPFGPDDAAGARMFTMASPGGDVTHRQLDLSYLVEPVPGLWLLSLDANVFAPRNGCPDNRDENAFDDSTDAGWNAVLRLKPFLVTWMADVAARAKAQGKRLVSFSHYPVADPIDGTLTAEVALFGASMMARRSPTPATTQAVAATGIGLHLSGHLHFHDVARVGGLTNLALPSPVAFPPAFGLLTCGAEPQLQMRLIDPPGFDAFFAQYRQEAARTGQDTGLLSADSYPRFLQGHLRNLVQQRFVPQEWPADLAAFLHGRSLADLEVLAGLPPMAVAGADLPRLPGGLSVLDLQADWYAARAASDLVAGFLPDARLAVYRRLMAAYAGGDWGGTATLQGQLAVFFDMFARYLGEDAVG